MYNINVNNRTAAQKQSSTKPYFFVTLFFLFLFPFYLWSPGYPQIADIFFVIVGAILFPRILLSKSNLIQDPAFWLGSFAFLTFVINLLHYTFLPDIRFFLSSMFYLYNTAIFLFFRYTFRQINHNYIDFFVRFLIFILLFQLAFSGFVQGPRTTGTFSNPNQLAYWALLISSIALALAYQRQFEFKHFVILALSSLLIVMSVSRSGLISMSLLLLIPLFFMKIDGRTKLAFAFIGLIFVFLLPLGITALLQSNTLDYLTLFENRFKAQSDPSYALWINRGFERFADQPIWFLIGAGEGGFERFQTTAKPFNLEVHSGIGTLFYSYGILGGTFFCIFYWSLVKRAGAIGLSLLLILLVYNVAHQAIRFSMFWVFLGILAAMQDRKIAARKTPSQPSAIKPNTHSIPRRSWQRMKKPLTNP